MTPQMALDIFRGTPPQHIADLHIAPKAKAKAKAKQPRSAFNVERDRFIIEHRAFIWRELDKRSPGVVGKAAHGKAFQNLATAADELRSRFQR